MLVHWPFRRMSWTSQVPATKSTRSPGAVPATAWVSTAGHCWSAGVASLQAGNMASSGWGGLLEALAPMASPQPKRPPFTTVVPGGAVAARAAPRVRAVLSPSTTSSGGWAS